MTPPTTASHSQNLAALVPVPLWAIFLFTFTNSVGTGVVTNGVFFLAKHGFGFSRTENYILGIVLGVTYVVASLFAGPALRRLEERHPSLTPRRVLAAVMVFMGACCVLPWVAQQVSSSTAEHAGAWSVWVMVLLYSPLSGLLWPIVEAFLAGGREGSSLRRSVGRWNVVWSAATAMSYWFSAPLIEHNPHMVLIALGGVHVLSALILRFFGARPMSHGEAGAAEDDRHTDPARYRSLLKTFRVLLPMSYIVSSALGPYLPEAMVRLGLAAHWAMPAASAWLVARVFTFATLERWHGWHGRWETPVVGVLLLLAGFGLAVLAPEVLGGTTALVGVIVGLLCFGTGMATIYCGALYYALALGNAEVEAGGTHEALIGLGYTIGPMCGYGATLVVSAGWLAPKNFEGAMLGVVASIALGVSALAWKRGRAARIQGGVNAKPEGSQ
jgi:hypothetical protein